MGIEQEVLKVCLECRKVRVSSELNYWLGPEENREGYDSIMNDPKIRKEYDTKCPACSGDTKKIKAS